MANTQQIPWNRISVEAAAIVASILLAFAIDAWWTERRDRSNEGELLARLETELSTNIEGLDEPQYRIGMQEAADLFEAVDAALISGKSSLDWPTLLVKRVVFMSSYEVNTPILTGLVSSGSLDLIDDANVVAALSKWEATIRNYTELVQRSRGQLDSQFIPALIERSDIGSVLAPRFSISELVNANPDYDDVIAIHLDMKFKGVLGARVSVTRISVAALGWARESGMELRNAIRGVHPVPVE